MEEEPEYKVIFLGNSGVGKTQLINSILGNKFDSESLSTTNATFLSKYIKIKKKNYKINLWDTAGQEIYKSITSLFVKGSCIVIFVYDITDQTSYDDLEFWIEKFFLLVSQQRRSKQFFRMEEKEDFLPANRRGRRRA